MVFLSQVLTIMALALLFSIPINHSSPRATNEGRLSQWEIEDDDISGINDGPMEWISGGELDSLSTDTVITMSDPAEPEGSFSIDQDSTASIDIGRVGSEYVTPNPVADIDIDTAGKVVDFDAKSRHEVGGGRIGCHTETVNEPEEGVRGWVWMTSVKCSGLDNLTIGLQQIPSGLASQISSIQITSSHLTTVNLTLFDGFPRLKTLSVIGCNVSELSGAIPSSLTNLNLSHNHLKSFGNSLFLQNTKSFPEQETMNHKSNLSDLARSTAIKPSFDYMSSKSRTDFPHNYHQHQGGNGIGMTSSGESIALSIGESRDDNRVGGNYNNPDSSSSNTDTNDLEITGSEFQLEVIDLSHNKITELHKSIFYLPRLQSLFLAGNHLKCDFVWEKLWGWTKKNSSQSILKDADETFCGVDEDVRVFQYTVQGVLQARKDLEETCSTVDTSLCKDCKLYALQRQNGHHTTMEVNSNGKPHKGQPRIAISLKLDCSSQNLTQLPPIPMQTWQLNISNNLIKDLSPLVKDEMYSNLLILDASNNSVNLESFAGSPFIDKYNYLNLQNNGFTTIPTYLLTSLKVIQGQGVTFLGGNQINCDCNYLKEIKPLLIENSKRIRDIKDIFCRDSSIPNTRVKDLQYSDVCHMDPFSDSEFNSDLVSYILILVEVLLIPLIILKVWHDQRTYRRTGVLPWCSINMPRLPCDAMLESLKGPPNLRSRPSTCGGIGSAASSNLNVVQQGLGEGGSVSHIQLRDLRPGGSVSGGASNTVSERSIQLQPKSSSSGSRTFSV